MTKLVNQIHNAFNQAADGNVVAAYNSYNGIISVDSRAELVLTKRLPLDESSVTLRETQQAFGGKRNLHTLKLEFIKEIADSIDEMYMTAKYRKVLAEPNWRTLFQVSGRNVNYIHGTAGATNNEDTMPCYLCGIVLPVSHITVDHHKPQSGGESQAILKNLRNLGHQLTHAAGHGSVATAYGTQQFQAIPTKSGGQPKLLHDDQAERYTLTARGITFLSAAIASTSLQRVADLCMHSVYNLKPFCAKCNITKSNRLTDLEWING
jgi:hypothetical protein